MEEEFIFLLDSSESAEKIIEVKLANDCLNHGSTFRNYIASAMKVLNACIRQDLTRTKLDGIRFYTCENR